MGKAKNTTQAAAERGEHDILGNTVEELAGGFYFWDVVKAFKAEHGLDEIDYSDRVPVQVGKRKGEYRGIEQHIDAPQAITVELRKPLGGEKVKPQIVIPSTFEYKGQNIPVRGWYDERFPEGFGGNHGTAYIDEMFSGH
ncbi:MAG: hypothetical protein ABIE22_02600 [archaeon]